MELERGRSDRLAYALVGYAVALAVFLLIPPTLKGSIGPPTAFTEQELGDLITPIVVIPLAWLVFENAGGLRGRALLAFLIVGAFWIEAQGIHLAANAIGDAFPAGPLRDAFYATRAGDLDHWLDEEQGHWVWHLAWAALSVLMVAQATRRSASGTDAGGSLPAVAGLIHGSTFFFVTTEGGTAALGIPLSLGLAIWSAAALRRGVRSPILRFFLVSSIATLAGYVAWAAVNGGRLVEPCAVIGC